MSSGNLSQTVFRVSLGAVGFLAVFMMGAFAYRADFPPFPQMKLAYRTLTAPDAFRDPIFEHLQPARGQGSGVVTNLGGDAGELVMLTGFFEGENQVRLIERDGTVVRRWSFDYFEHFPDPEDRFCDLASPLQTDLHGAVITPQGEVLANYEYCGTVKVDHCGDVQWTIAAETHHSLVAAEAGGYWILGRDRFWAHQEPDRFPPFSSAATEEEILDDTVMRVSADGEVLASFSIAQLMRDNGLEPILTGNGENFNGSGVRRSELVHSNQANELSGDLADAFPLFEAGDLAISMRELNLVMVIDPETRSLKWHQVGPWLRQHDAEFRADGRLSIFNNNTYRYIYSEGQTNLDAPRTTNIIAIDPVSRETEVIFGERPGQEMLSVIRGQHEMLPELGTLIVEFDAGRVIEVDADGRILWEYVNSYDADFVGEVTNAAIYSADYFDVEWDECDP